MKIIVLTVAFVVVLLSTAKGQQQGPSAQVLGQMSQFGRGEIPAIPRSLKQQWTERGVPAPKQDEMWSTLLGVGLYFVDWYYDPVPGLKGRVEALERRVEALEKREK